MRYPVYIPSKGRATIANTPHELDGLDVPYRLVVEEQERAEYASVFGADRVLVLDPAYQREYEAMMPLRDDEGRGSGPARNFIWDHAEAEGHGRHWIMDDNIACFVLKVDNREVRAGDSTMFDDMERFVDRFSNVGLAGPEYNFFSPMRAGGRPLRLNTRAMSCILVNHEMDLRWRCRYNEDIDLGLRAMKAGWVIMQFTTMLQRKAGTQTTRGGNTDELYANGTLVKSQMLADLHPDCVTTAMRYGRVHHVVDVSQFRRLKPVRRVGVEDAVAPRRLVEQPKDYAAFMATRREKRARAAAAGADG